MEVGNKCLCPDLDSPYDVERRAVNDMKNKMLALRRAIMVMTLMLPALYMIIYYQNPASMPTIRAMDTI